MSQWERDMEIRDRYALMAYGMKRKAAWIRKNAILDSVFELKRRFKILLFQYLQKREDRKFQELQDLILTFDKKPGYKEKFEEDLQKRPKLSSFRPPKAAIEAVAFKDDIPLGTVNEENEDDFEQSNHKMTPCMTSGNLSTVNHKAALSPSLQKVLFNS